MRHLLLTSIVLSLALASGCSKSGDDSKTGETMMDKAKSAVDATTDKAGDMATGAAGAVKDAGSAAMDSAGDMATGAKDAVKDAGKATLDKAGDVAQGAADALHDAAGTAENDAKDAAADTMKDTQH